MIQKIMKTCRLAFVLLLIALLPSFAYGFGGCEEDCLKCHKITKPTAETILKPLIPDVAVDEVSMSPAKGLWEIVLTTRGKKQVAYVDFSLENIIIGQIIHIKSKHNLTQERLVELAKVDYGAIPLTESLVMGSKKAPYKIFVFSDPD